MKKTRYLIIAIIIAAFVFPNCGGKSGRKEGPTIFTKGKPVRLTKGSIDSYGGQIVVDKPGDPLDGLTIDIPENAYDEEKKFRISYEEIKDHDLGKYFNPLTPLISIENGGGYSEEPMVLTIPVKVKPDEFAMAFYYNTRTGRLEGIPLLASDEEKVVVATRRFGLVEEDDHSLGLASQAGQSLEEQEKIIITAAKEKDIRGDHSSGFTPGRDDLPSTNYGSTIAHGGHCAGQSMAMLWYYTNKKLNGAPALHQLLDNDGKKPASPGFWQDDNLSIKLSSVLQNEYFSSGMILRILPMMAQVFGQVLGSDRLTMNAFRYAILLTQEPQFVAIYSNKIEGHALVVYKIKDNALYVADPNYPGSTKRKIQYNELDKLFTTYNSGATAASIGTKYTRIFYLAKSSFPPWPFVKKHWQETEEKTIGESDYPSYELVAMDENVEFVPLEDGFKIPDGRLTLNLRNKDMKFSVYNSRGKLVPRDNMTFYISPGEERIGIEIKDDSNYWVGFKWVKVKTGEDRSIPVEEKRPTFGVMYVDMEVNGQKFPVDTTQFQMSPGSKFFALRAYGFKPKPTSEDYSRDHLHIEADNCTGVGYYNDVVATWNDDASDGAEYKGTGRLEITSWKPGVLNGSFSFTVTEQNAQYGDPRVKTITGSFRYKGKVYED